MFRAYGEITSVSITKGVDSKLLTMILKRYSTDDSVAAAFNTGETAIGTTIQPLALIINGWAGPYQVL